jgi:hypothetical protein
VVAKAMTLMGFELAPCRLEAKANAIIKIVVSILYHFDVAE